MRQAPTSDVPLMQPLVQQRARTVSELALRVILLGAAVCLEQCAPSAPDTADHDLLQKLHEKCIRAHRESNVDLLLEDMAADFVLVNRGEVTRPSLDEMRGSLGSYLRSTTFQEYGDLTDPVINVSSDGTLGWVIVQVRAKGVSTAADGTKKPLEFVSGWIELYEKRNGAWRRVGNVSNFKP